MLCLSLTGDKASLLSGSGVPEGDVASVNGIGETASVNGIGETLVDADGVSTSLIVT